MKKNQKHGEEHDTEILKAVAQAWQGQSSSSKGTTTISESDAHRLSFMGKPSRFKLEATSMMNKKSHYGTSWDFGQSLWDSYEIVSVSKKLETGLVMDSPFSTLNEEERCARRRRERSNSLRNLLNRLSSRRFSEAELPSEGD